MTFERPVGAPPEHGQIPVASTASDGEPTPLQIRLQILSTEHWSLLASRSLAWNESFTRAGMFLATLSGSIVALGLIAGIAGFDDAFFVFALVILPVDLFVGIGTWFRMAASNYHDAIAIAGMNRIRAGYLQIAPDLEPYFVMGVHDDAPGIGRTMAVPPGTPAVVHLIAGTPTIVMVLNGVLAGAIVAIVLIRTIALSPVPTVAGAAIAAALVIALEFQVARRNIRRGRQALEPMFPTPPEPRRG
jgi:hypothetical protein